MSTTNPTNITSEWDDLQRKFGNFAPLVKEPTEEEKTKALIEATESVDFLAPKSLKELEILDEDAQEDDNVLNRYRKARLNQIKIRQKRNRYGEVYCLSKEDFINEVTKASEFDPTEEEWRKEEKKDREDAEINDESSCDKGTWIIVLLYQEYCNDCAVLNKILDALASEYKYIKFMKGIASSIVENYPDQKLPTVLIYRGGKCRYQVVGTSDWGGKSMTVASVTKILKRKYKIFDNDLDGKVRSNCESEEESDRSDDTNQRIRSKGYSSLKMDSWFQKGY